MSIGPRRLPPLSALRAFEAAARHLSFKKAASELYVSPAAISHHVSTLEEHLGVKLFERLNRGLSLTDVGRAGLSSISNGFLSLQSGVELMRNTRGRATLTVRAGPAFTAKWLVPRLGRFVAGFPEIDVRIAASMHAVDGDEVHPPAAEAHDPAAADVEIRFGNGYYPGCVVEKLLPVKLTPVCSPRLLAGAPALHSVQDLRHHTLLHDDALAAQHGHPDWSLWLRLAGASEVNAGRGAHFTHSALALQAAAEGLGVALAMDVLAAADIAAGHLVAPFDLSVPLPLAYYIVSPPARSRLRPVVAFHAWLLQEAQAALRDVAAAAPSVTA